MRQEAKMKLKELIKEAHKKESSLIRKDLL